MITLRVTRDGNVTGDVNSIAAHDNEKYSKPIRILHPDFPQVVHLVKYHQGHIDAFEIISADDIFRFLVNSSGPVHFQYIAQNKCTGQTVFASKPFMLTVGKGENNCCHDSVPVGFDIQTIRDELFKLHHRLKEVGILPQCNKGIITNCNQLLLDSECLVLEGSINTPEGVYKATKKYLIRIRIIDNITIQIAQLLQPGSKSIFYRTGYAKDANNYVWTDWDTIAFASSLGVIYTDNIDTVPFKAGQLIVVKDSNNYYLYYDIPTGFSKNDRVLISADANNSDTIVSISDEDYSNYTYTVNYKDITVPYSGMLCVFTPNHDMIADHMNLIKFNEDISGIYIKDESGSLAIMNKPLLKQGIPTLLIYSNKRWIANIPTVSFTDERFEQLLNAFDFDNNVIKDEFIPDTIERVANKVMNLSDDSSYEDNQYPSAEATKSYVSDKISDIEGIWIYRNK